MLKYVFMIQFLDTINCGAVGAKGDNCSDNATCTDGNGSYMCECKDGFTGDGFTCTGIIFLILNLKQTILHRFHEEKIERVHIVTIWQGSFQSISFTPHTLKFGQIYPF